MIRSHLIVARSFVRPQWQAPMTSVKFPVPCRRVGAASPHHYFFGYYNKSNWDKSGRYLLAQEVPWADAVLRPGLEAGIGFFDLADGDRFSRVATTRAWNWQMGSQLQWLDALPGRQMIYNVRTDDATARYPYFGAEICDADSGRKRQLPMPVYVVAPNGRWALTVDYRRLYVTHQTIGYSCDRFTPRLELHPRDDGIYRMELDSGAARLLVSYDALRNFHPRESMRRAIHWVSHIEVNPASDRVLFLHRWTERVADETCFLHRLITMNPDGSGMRLLECSDHPLPQLAEDFDPGSVGTFDYEKSEHQISHPLWRNDREIIVWGPHDGRIHYHLYRDEPQVPVSVVGADVLTENGHMTFSPVDGRWLLSDTYPDAGTHERMLIMFDVATGRRYELGNFYADPTLSKENRCDLHPRWRPDGRQVCVDSIHQHDRAMYVLDVGGLVTGAVSQN